ncbi:MAG: hypothetical protein U0992_03065 [Planctomycetaceae bacterium]
MRRLSWCCVVGGVLGIGVGVGLSQERAPYVTRLPSAFAPASGAKSSTGATRPARKTYYSELFGNGTAATTTSESDRTSAAGELPPQAEPAADAELPTVTPDQSNSGRNGSFNLSGRSLPAADEADNDAVIHAAFDRSAGDIPANDIIPVGGQRVVRPPRKPRVDRSALTEPIAIPVKAETEAVEPLFDSAPEAPEGEQAQAMPAPRMRSSIAQPRASQGPESIRNASRAKSRSRPAPSFVTDAPAAPVAEAVPAAPMAAAVPAPAPAQQAPNVRVAWNKQGEVSIGRECQCELTLENTGAAAHHLEVVALFSDNVRLLKSDPPPSSNGASLVWEIDELPAGGTRTIQITMMPLGAGEINTQAEVRYSTAISESFQVAEPKLALKLSGPPQTMLGDSATQTILITNPGTGVAGNVQIAAVIPSGLEHARGSELLMEIGALHPGETRSVRLPLAAVSGGRHIVQVEARGDGGLVDHASCAVTVIAPQMQAAIEGPGLRYLGRRAAYSIAVTNEGSVPSENVRVMHKIPEGFKFVSADHGGQFDSSTELLNWFVGRLEAGQTVTLAATFECKQIGEFTHFVRCTNDQGAISDSQVTTLVEGTPRLSMSIRDLDDPVETGAETAYEVEIKNEGSAAATRVQLTCELPDTMTLVKITGPLSHREAAGVVAFAPLAELGPGETKTVQIHVRSTAAGNLRLRAQLASESIDEPLVQEELTKFYGE